MRKRVFEIIETAKEDDRWSNVYDIFMMIVIVASLIPLTSKNDFLAYTIIDKIADRRLSVKAAHSGFQVE